MIKLVFCVRRRPDIDEAEFHRYWRDEHGPLVRRHAEVLRIRRYVQTHRIDTPANDALRASRNTQQPYDGVAELWWESIDDLAAGTSSPEGIAAAQALLEDEQRFIDLEHCALWLNEEAVIIE
jgi:uncharacterized protein (TIGR02118 family)